MTADICAILSVLICFQAGSETAAIARGVAAELGPLANTQGKVEAGPFATPAKP